MLWDVIRSLLTWAEAKADERSGRVQAQGAVDEIRQNVEVLALNGFYSVLVEGDLILVMRDTTGGVALAGPTERPSGGQTYPEGPAEPGDRGIVGWDAKSKQPGLRLRIRGTELEVFGATKISLNGGDRIDLVASEVDVAAAQISLGGDVPVVRHGDNVPANTAMAVWMAAVAAHTHLGAVPPDPALSPPPQPIGTCAATTDKVRAG